MIPDPQTPEGREWLRRLATDGDEILLHADQVLALLDALDRTQRGGRTLGRIVDRLHREMLDATGAHDLIGEDGDGDWQLVSELLQELRPARDAALARAAKAEAALDRVRALCMSTDGDWINSDFIGNTVGDIRAALDGTS